MVKTDSGIFIFSTYIALTCKLPYTKRIYPFPYFREMRMWKENVKQNVTQIDATKEKLCPLRLDNLYCEIMELSN